MAFLPLETGRRSHGTRVRVNQRAAAAPVSVSVTIIANRSPQPSHSHYKWRNSQFLLFSKCHTLMKRVGKSERGEREREGRLQRIQYPLINISPSSLIDQTGGYWEGHVSLAMWVSLSHNTCVEPHLAVTVGGSGRGEAES